MGDEERLVAVVSPWERLADLVKHKFRVESLPAEKLVMVWRDDLQSEAELTQELRAVGIKPSDVRRARVTTRWREVE